MNGCLLLNGRGHILTEDDDNCSQVLVFGGGSLMLLINLIDIWPHSCKNLSRYSFVNNIWVDTFVAACFLCGHHIDSILL